MSKIQPLLIESKKHKRRFNFLLFAAVILFEIFFVYGNYHKKTGLTDGWMILFYNMPIMNSLFFPVFLSVFASRLVDIEHKGDMLKCLYTFSSPEKLYYTKLLYGIIHILIFIPFHCLSILVMAKLLDFPTNFPVSCMLYYGTSTLLSCILLFLLQFLLSYFFKNQAVAISVGIIGSFMGLFTAYLPTSLFQKLLPWSTFVNSMFIGMNWDRKTRETSWFLMETDFEPIVICILWISLIVAASILLLRKAGIEDSETKKRSTSVITPVHIHKSPVEFLKLKGSPSWYAFFIIPLLSAIIGTLNYRGNIDILKNGWFSLWTQHTLFLCYFFMPVMIAVFNGCIWRLEHFGTNMNILLTHSTPTKIILDKFAASIFITSLSLIWIVFLYIVSGLFCHIDGSIPAKLPLWLLFGALGAYSICALQLFFSLVIRNFVLPIAFGFCGGILGLACIAKGAPLSLPYSLFSLAMAESKKDLNPVPFLITAFTYIAIFLLLSIFYLKHADVKTHE